MLSREAIRQRTALASLLSNRPIMSPDPKTDTRDSINVPWEDIVRFIRQLSHDLRNHLNAAELQSAYLAEIASDPEVKDEVKRLREMVSVLGAALQQLSTSVIAPKATLLTYGASEFVEDLRTKIGSDFPKESAGVKWEVALEKADLNIDPQLLPQAILELFRNAFRHIGGGTITASARIEEKRFLFVLRETKEKFEPPKEDWDRPLRAVGHGHYGLGLNRARAIVEANGGTLTARYDNEASALITTVALPVAGSAS